MSLSLECKKLKRTGFVAAFIGGGLLAAMVPVANMAVRSEIYVGIDSSPIWILMSANWKMIAMLNVLLIVTGACIMYYTEYADNAIQKMYTLPIKESSLFLCKFALLAAMGMVMLLLEAAGIAFCSVYWFEPAADLCLELLKNFGYALALLIPAVMVSLLIASLCKNMWVSLGIGIVCIFIATMLPANHFMLSIFPFALPFQVLAEPIENTSCNYLIVSVLETAIITFAEMLLIKVRRSME